MPTHQHTSKKSDNERLYATVATNDYSIRPTESKPLPKKSQHSKRKTHHLLFIFISLIFIIATWKGVDFLEMNEAGEVILSKKRKTKLETNLKELQEGEQYALIVTQTGIFPCYSCVHSSTIQLFPGQIWKYGVTMKGQQGRYKGSLPVPNVLYREQFVGTLQDCYMEEQRKIFNYALLPENITRKTPLIRPPGNKYDK